MPSYQQIFENNKAWIAQQTSGNADFFAKLNEGQSPEYLYIGCSDSRVTAEDMMGLQPGEVFVHRNVANVISTLDLNAASVIEYAISHLKVQHIVVCGHYSCGGVKAAMTAADLGILNPWLRNIRDVYRLHQAELDGIADEHARYDRLVELNAQEQAINIMKMAAFQKATHKPEVHAWVFDIATGRLIDLEVDFSETTKGIDGIFDLGV